MKKYKLVDEKLAQQILNEYVSGKTYKEIEKQYNISTVTIGKLIDGVIFENCTRPKNIKEIGRRRNGTGFSPCIDHVIPIQEQIEIINGSMLGDGTIVEGYFSKSQCPENKEYLDHLFNKLKPFSNTISEVYKDTEIVDINNGNKIYKKVDRYLALYQFRTYTHPYFKSLRELWYPYGKKIVPSNIELTPLTICIWAMDDGFNYKKGRLFGFCTNGFSYSSVEFLQFQLENNFGIKSKIKKSKNKGQPIIHVTAHSYDKLIELISKNNIWDCFKRKIEKRELIKKYLTEEEVVIIFNMWDKGYNVKYISNYLKITINKVYGVLKGETWAKWQNYCKTPYDPNISHERSKSHFRHPVKCIETNEKFSCAKEAGLKYDTDPSSILKSIKRNGTCCGLHWEKIKKTIDI